MQPAHAGGAQSLSSAQAWLAVDEHAPSGSGVPWPQSQIQRPTVVMRSPVPAQAKSG